MHDTGVEDGLRQAFRAETDGLGLTITAAELERRLQARRGSRNGRRLSLIAAGIAIVAVGTIGALSNGWLHLPAIGTTGAPSPSPSPTASTTPAVAGVLAPIPATPGRIEVTRIDPTAPTDPVDRRFQGQIKDPFIVTHVTISCLGNGTLDFYLDAQREHADCSSDGEVSSGGTVQVTDDSLDYRLVTTGRISFGVLVELQVLSEPLPSQEGSPAPFTPPAMQVSVSTLGQPGETLDLTTGCWFTYILADGTTGDGGCAEPSASLAPICCETLDVPYGSDLTFTVPGGWSIDHALIDTIGYAWVDDRSAPSRTITGWRSIGDLNLRFEGTFSKGGESFKTSFDVPIHGSVAVPAALGPARACGTPDLSVTTPPAVRLVLDGGDSVAGTVASTNWGTASHPVDGDPVPDRAIRIPAGTSLALWIADDVCATDWRIEYGPPLNGSSLSIDRVGSLVLAHRTPPDGPVNGHQNRFDLAQLPPGEWYIEAELRFADGDAAVGWHVIVK